MSFLLTFLSNLVTSQVFWIWFFICATISVAYTILIAQLSVDSELQSLSITFDDEEV